MIKIIILILLFASPLYAGTGLLPSHYRIDQRLSSGMVKGSKDLNVKIYLSDDDFESALDLLESKGIILRYDIKENKKEASDQEKFQNKELPGLKDLKDSFDRQGFKDLKTLSDYQRYSGRMEDGSIVILASHYFDSKEKRWIKKTNVLLISPVETEPLPPPTKPAPEKVNPKAK